MEIHLSGSPIIRIGLALRIIFPRILQNLACLEITDYQMYSTVLWLLELQIRSGQKV